MLLAIAFVVGGVAFAMLWKELAARNRPRRLSKLAGGAAIALLAVLLLLTATGRLHWLAALLAGLLPLARWAFGLVAGPLVGSWLRRTLGSGTFGFGSRPGAADPGAGSPPKASTVATADLKMTLHHETGEMDGEALTGSLAGQRLSDLDLATIQGWRGELANADSLQLLDAYLDRRSPGWTDAPRDDAAPAGAAMDETQALAVLGLAQGASEEEVVDAHRRLMQKLHPDRGGTDYLAATLNRAKAVLVGGRTSN